ncbi:hypothetical protein C5N14_19270 [Micromonospora sp. MW-13]|uniref:hypothetical protein n=1 Tax=Micromonospora sp. MW-13 TaxID=2094022 RepID=UPI000EE3BF2B|nr:hypothetical protein [Micromonospora sp. MW-13]RGC67498.1 hypothetical protein C5N14_19270 [Micromonospora sp. MW-13]
MNAHRMDQETVERLLAGSAVGPQAGPQALVRLLAAVRAAPRPEELRGEDAALRAFRVAHGTPAVPVPARGARRTVLTGLLGVKAVLAALAVAATGGVTLAAVHGALPPLAGTVDRPAAPAPATGRPVPDGGPATRPSPAGTRAPEVPPARLLTLCRALRDEATQDRALTQTRYAQLVEAAGGRDRVTGWCAEALAEAGPDASTGPAGTATAPPGGQGQPDGPPGQPSEHPSPPAVPSLPASPALPATPPLPGRPSVPAVPADPSLPARPSRPADPSPPADSAASTGPAGLPAGNLPR